MKNYWKSSKISRVIPPLDKIIVVKIALYLLFFKLALKILPFSTFKTFYKNLTQTKTTVKYTIEHVTSITKGIKKASQIPFLSFSCLTQAITTKFLLHSDRDVVLIIGVNIENGFEAHAWVEKSGYYIIGDTPMTKFIPLWYWE